MDRTDSAPPADPELEERLRALEARLPAIERALALLAASHQELGGRLAALGQAVRARAGGDPERAPAAVAAPLERIAREIDALQRQAVRIATGLPHRPPPPPGEKAAG